MKFINSNKKFMSFNFICLLISHTTLTKQLLVQIILQSNWFTFETSKRPMQPPNWSFWWKKKPQKNI